MKVNNTFLIFSLLLSFVAYSQQNFNVVSKGHYAVTVFDDENNSSDSVWITGKIFRKENTEPLLSAAFEVDGVHAGCVTDSLGYFQYKIKMGLYKFKFRYVGLTQLKTKSIKIEAKHKYSIVAYLEEGGKIY